jgi:hypothetical protein
LLRAELATKSGEIVEARDRISQLEMQLNTGVNDVQKGITDAGEKLGETVAKMAEVEGELKAWRERNGELLVEIEEGRIALARKEATLAAAKESFVLFCFRATGSPPRDNPVKQDRSATKRGFHREVGARSAACQAGRYRKSFQRGA